MAVFIISGLWHGAAFTFIIWGAIHGIVQVGEKLLYGDRLRNLNINAPLYLRLIRGFATFSVVSFAWIFFRMPSVEETFYVISHMFTNFEAPFLDVEIFVYAGLSLALMLLIDSYLYKNNNNYFQIINKSPKTIYISCIFLLFYILLMGQFDGDSFIYFQF